VVTLDLPPPFRLVTLREVGDAFSHATDVAVQEGAGTLVHVGRFDLAEFALVLEPDEPLRVARRAFYAGMVALADALAAHAPPEKPITFDWPDAIRIDGGLIGGGRLGRPGGVAEDEVPPWIVFGAMVRTVAMGQDEPGLRLSGSALDQEGFGDVDSGRLVESFARHFMRLVDVWHERGFGVIARDYLARLPPDKDVRRDIDENGDLLKRAMKGNLVSSGIEHLSLTDALVTVSWFDRATRGPRL